MKTIQTLSIAVSVVALTAGISYSVADGVLNDAEYTREHGGVGNYLFYGNKVETAKVAEAPADYVEVDNSTSTPVATNDTINLGASSAGRAH